MRAGAHQVTNGPFATIPTFADATKQRRLTERGSTRCRKLYFTLHYRFCYLYRLLRPLESPGVPRVVDAKMQRPSANKNEEKQHLIVQRLLSRLDGRLPNSSSLRSRSATPRPLPIAREVESDKCCSANRGHT